MTEESSDSSNAQQDKEMPSASELQGPASGYSELTSLWGLRIIVRLNMYNKFVDQIGGFYNEEILAAIDLLEHYKLDTDTDRAKGLKIVTERLEELESNQTEPEIDTLTENIGILEQALSLSKTEVEILRFVLICSSASTFGYLVDSLGELNSVQTNHVLSVVLNFPQAEIDQALRAHGTLLSSGLLRIEGGAYLTPLRGRLVVPQTIKYTLSQEHDDSSGVLQCFFRKSIQARLELNDFPHLQSDIDLLYKYLQSVTSRKTHGVNVLVYGEPGTGKTELVRTLASASDLQLYEITMQDTDGEAIDGRDRFSALQLAQKLLANQSRCVIMFDEIEDVFPAMDHMLFQNMGTVELKKAWVNNQLEENPIPVFWVCNSTRQIQPSFLRRFDYSLQLQPPTLSVRRRILEKYLGHLPVSEHWLSQLADHEQLVPAHIERAAKVADHLGTQDPHELEQTLNRVIGNSLVAMGLPRKPRNQKQYTTRYSLDFLNPDSDLNKLTEGLGACKSARICLYGPPGTGKTAFGHYLAEQLDKPLLMKRASDILSKWVGESEQNIAEMFQHAEAENMVLLLDEADSFLQDRSGSHASWEITQVNELLVQMESFEGIFVASTNLMDTLDSASLRRFDVKIKFDFMKTPQAWELFSQVLREQEQLNETLPQTIQQRLMQLDQLTPGDFATVIRQAQCINQPIHSQWLIEALEKECAAKPGHRKPIGFTSH